VYILLRSCTLEIGVRCRFYRTVTCVSMSRIRSSRSRSEVRQKSVAVAGQRSFAKKLRVIERLFSTEFLKRNRARYCWLSLCYYECLIKVKLNFLFSRNRVDYFRKSARCSRPKAHTYGRNNILFIFFKCLFFNFCF